VRREGFLIALTLFAVGCGNPIPLSSMESPTPIPVPSRALQATAPPTMPDRRLLVGHLLKPSGGLTLTEPLSYLKTAAYHLAVLSGDGHTEQTLEVPLFYYSPCEPARLLG
jgi:hypothetical protein